MTTASLSTRKVMANTQCVNKIPPGFQYITFLKFRQTHAPCCGLQSKSHSFLLNLVHCSVGTLGSRENVQLIFKPLICSEEYINVCNMLLQIINSSKWRWVKNALNKTPHEEIQWCYVRKLSLLIQLSRNASLKYACTGKSQLGECHLVAE